MWDLPMYKQRKCSNSPEPVPPPPSNTHGMPASQLEHCPIFVTDVSWFGQWSITWPHVRESNNDVQEHLAVSCFSSLLMGWQLSCNYSTAVRTVLEPRSSFPEVRQCPTCPPLVVTTHVIAAPSSSSNRCWYHYWTMAIGHFSRRQVSNTTLGQRI